MFERVAVAGTVEFAEFAVRPAAPPEGFTTPMSPCPALLEAHRRLLSMSSVAIEYPPNLACMTPEVTPVW